MRYPRVRTLIAGLAAALTLGGLATPTGAAPAGGGSAKCPLSALDKADKPVEITLWHSMTRENEATLVRLTDAFNSSQGDVRVELVNQTTYEDTLEKYKAGLGTGELPDLVQIEDTGLQQMIDTQSVLPAASCVRADDYSFDGHIPRVVDYYTVDGTLWPMPFNVSNPVLYYNKTLFEQAGLDPERPPATLGEVREYSEQIKAAGIPYGFALRLHTWHLEQWLAKANETYVNHKNGRAGRADEATFDNETGDEVFAWMAGMVNDDLAITNPRLGEGAINNFLAVANGEAAMTIDTSAALGTVNQVLSSGQYAGVEAGVAPMPSTSKTGGGVSVGGAALYLVNKSKPAEQAAAWEFAKFLNEPEQVAEWAAGTGYIPIRTDAVDLPVVRQRWAELPGFRVAYDQLTTGPDNVATSGPVIGAFEPVRVAIEDEYVRMFTQSKKPKAALKAAASGADEAMQDYNDRVGG